MPLPITLPPPLDACSDDGAYVMPSTNALPHSIMDPSIARNDHIIVGISLTAGISNNVVKQCNISNVVQKNLHLGLFHCKKYAVVLI